MDLSHYIKKSETARRTVRGYSLEKRCLNCGRKIEKNDTENHLYLQSFCSSECKERYVNAVEEA